MSLFSRLIQAITGTPRRAAIDATPARPIHARYDAAQSSGMNSQHWGAVDAYDADSANSVDVRAKLRQRSRYEVNNNGHAKGITLTQANYVVGRGPKLRMQTGSPGMNAMVEAAWNRWTKRVKLARKLRTAVKAKVTDGEAFILARSNPGLRDRVGMDLVCIEAEQCASQYTGLSEPYKVDGIKFDEFGNPLYYEILRYHPGSQWTGLDQKPEQVPAKFVFHLYREDRPGQHRAVPETTSTLNLFGVGRRWRESTVVAAENIANFSVLLHTQQSPNDGPDEVRPLSTLPIEKGMMTALPMGYDIAQPKAEQPAGTYDMLNRELLCEEARPLSMPYNIAACDSSGYSFSGGKLDHLTYFVSVDTEQADIEDLVLDPLFELWFEEAVSAYGWTLDASSAPLHTWDWPARPQIDEQKTASARKTTLGFGGSSRRRFAAEDGIDLEDEDQQAAEDYGVSVEEYRRRLFDINLPVNQSGSAASDTSDEEDEEPPPRRNGSQSTNGNGRGRVRV